MKASMLIGSVMLVCTVFLSGMTSAAPQYSSEAPFASEESTLNQQQPKLVIVCKVPEEFAQTSHPTGAPAPTLQTSFPGASGGQRAATGDAPPAVPEPSTIMLIGLGLLGILGLVRRMKA